MKVNKCGRLTTCGSPPQNTGVLTYRVLWLLQIYLTSTRVEGTRGLKLAYQNRVLWTRTLLTLTEN